MSGTTYPDKPSPYPEHDDIAETFPGRGGSEGGDVRPEPKLPGDLDEDAE